MSETEKLQAELAGVVNVLRDVLATGTLRPCLERTNAIYYLNRHKNLLKDRERS